MWWVLVILVVLVRSSEASVSVSCRDENNNEVDWYILYKAPAIQTLNGLEYIYIDNSGKRVMPQPINHATGVLANTLNPMLTSTIPSSLGFLSYSDQSPNGNAPSRFGHSKGVVLGDSGTQTALWLTHSTPQFPFNRAQGQFWPSSGTRNGQTFMCVTLPFSELSAVGKHLQYIQAFPFDKELPSGFPRELIDAANGVSAPPPGEFINLTTKGKKEMKMRAKQVSSNAIDGDLYVALAAGFGSNVSVQTWGCQKGRDQSFCEPNKPSVMNVEAIQTDLGAWMAGNDHSKWAVTTAENIGWTCISDVNRATSQYQRFGGALCIQDRSVNSYFKGFVSSTLPCRKRPRECTSDELDTIFDAALLHSAVSCAISIFFCVLVALIFFT